mgnify:CR=1 FL=1
MTLEDRAGPEPPASASANGPDRGKASLRLWLRLIACEGLLEHDLRARMRERFGLTLPQFDVLAELARFDEPINMTELSKRLMVSNGNVTGVIDRLVREGLVARSRSPEDRRAHLIALTPEGESTFRRVAAEHERWVEDLLGGLDGEELEVLTALLTRTQIVLKNRLGR